MHSTECRETFGGVGSIQPYSKTLSLNSATYGWGSESDGCQYIVARLKWSLSYSRTLLIQSPTGHKNLAALSKKMTD